MNGERWASGSLGDLPEPLYGQIRSALRARIVDGTYGPGTRMPSESELGERFNASRITVRQALAELQKEGLIHTLQGKGSFVSRPKAYQYAHSLMGFAEQMGSRGYEVVNELLALEDVPADAALAARLDVEQGRMLTHIRRVRYLNGAPVSMELTWVPQLIGRQLAKANLATRDIFLILENDCGIALGHADLTVEAVLASEEIGSPIGVQPGGALLRIERLTHDSQGRPVDYEFLYFRGDAFQYRFKVERQAAWHQGAQDADNRT